MTPVRPPHTPDPLNLRGPLDGPRWRRAEPAQSRRPGRSRPGGCAAALPPHRGRDVEDWAWQQARPAGHDGGAGSACRGDYSLAWYGGAVRADDHRRFGRRVGRFDRSGARQACRGTGGNGGSPCMTWRSGWRRTLRPARLPTASVNSTACRHRHWPWVRR